MNLINLILILLSIDGIFKMIFKPKQDRFGCGIFAWAGKSPRTFNKSTFEILGILNETRGKDSCGVSTDGEIYVGVDKDKIFRDFLVNKNYPAPLEIPIVIGHTRASTVGSNSKHNAHPFGFGESKKFENSYGFIGCHNGTLHNHKDLAKMFGVDIDKKFTNDKNVKWSTTKIDSEVLLECIYKNKNFKVLSKYNGAAAIVFYHVDKPDTIYCFHGASTKTSFDDKLFIERPLFGYQEHKNSLYISSQEDSLFIIGGTVDNVFEFDTNTVYEIKNGNMKTAKKIKLSRVDQQIEKEYAYEKRRKQEAKDAKITTVKRLDCAYEFPVSNNNGEGGHGCNYQTPFPSRTQNIHSISGDFNIHLDKKVGPPSKRIFMEGLRYKRNGHIITGIYVWVDDFGFYLLDNNILGAEKQFRRLVNKKFIDGDFIHTEDKLTKSDDAIIPFPAKAGFTSDYTNPMKFFSYFYQGVKIKSFVDFTAVSGFANINHKITIEALSNISAHPIMEIKKHSTPISFQGIFHEGVLANGKFCPVGSEKIYEIENGNCIGIELVSTDKKTRPYSNLELVKIVLEEHEKVIIKDELKKSGKKVLSLDEVTKEILKHDEKSVNKLKSLSVALDDDEELIKLLDDLFIGPMEKAQIARDKLADFRKTEKGKEALGIFQDFLDAASHLVSLEINN